MSWLKDQRRRFSRFKSRLSKKIKELPRKPIFGVVATAVSASSFFIPIVGPFLAPVLAAGAGAWGLKVGSRVPGSERAKAKREAAAYEALAVTEAEALAAKVRALKVAGIVVVAAAGAVAVTGGDSES